MEEKKEGEIIFLDDEDNKVERNQKKQYPKETTEKHFLGLEKNQKKLDKESLERLQEKISRKPLRITPQITSDAQAISEEKDKERQVAMLVDLAQDMSRGGVEYAFRVALRLDDAYIVDTLRDTLVEHYDELVSQGNIRPDVS